MFRPIEKCARRALVSGSLAIAICTLYVVPLAGSPSGYNSPSRLDDLKSAIARRDDPWKSTTVKVTRDPFLLEPIFTKASILPRPAGGHRLGGPPAPQASVVGVAFGQKPEAVIEVEGSIRIVAPGDFIKGVRIASILSDRILLNDGSVLLFSSKLH